MKSTTLLAVVSTATLALARKCHDIKVPVSISAENMVFDLEPPTTEIDVTNFYLNLAQQGANFPGALTTGTAKVSGHYVLQTTYCEPDDGPGHTLQVMTHGVGFDRSYWDLPFQAPKYSYVAEAVDVHGYSTLTWDRLGVGMSTHPDDTVNETQLALEVAALKALTKRLRAGKVCDIPTPYHSIVHLGHSFGSAITYNLVNDDPKISQGIVLTGFSQISDFLGQFALGANFVPVREVAALAARYEEGYIAAGSAVGVHIAFLPPGGEFDPDILDFGFAHAQPHTTGELLTVGVGTGEINAFAGPCMIITGERDVPFCGGDCMGTAPVDGKFDNLIQASAPMFPQASVFNATVVPKAAHGLHFGYSAPDVFATILDFLGTQV
ncbi:uncharacterized protein F5Z01DRAFT_456893 [Emericellopsis atlantica]|uniref:AB hydrolase-1 domain-containing protein n=1 Tax=Emericellopsis atlantica TaxID=2614577 RepID=A0A9P7ZT62_9HYPO|nr:uncharacterized protein F5Z01DRAFT_456893 [Emericellopsis atlantica]KAG9257178.1 hypothetical protein F5Z01DRAFT_456893 [Emericellopsis atlantica]